MNDAKEEEAWAKFYKQTADGRWHRKNRAGHYAILKNMRRLKRLTILPAVRLRKADLIAH